MLEPASAPHQLTLQRNGGAWNMTLLTMCSLDRVPGPLLQGQSLQNEKQFTSQILNGCSTVATLCSFGNSLPLSQLGAVRGLFAWLSSSVAHRKSRDKGRVFEYLLKFSEQQSVAGLRSGGEEESATLFCWWWLFFFFFKCCEMQKCSKSSTVFSLLAVGGRGK